MFDADIPAPLTPSQKRTATRRANAARRAVIAASRGATLPVRVLPRNVIDLAAVRASRQAARVATPGRDWAPVFSELATMWAPPPPVPLLQRMDNILAKLTAMNSVDDNEGLAS